MENSSGLHTGNDSGELHNTELHHWIWTENNCGGLQMRKFSVVDSLLQVKNCSGWLQMEEICGFRR